MSSDILARESSKLRFSHRDLIEIVFVSLQISIALANMTNERLDWNVYPSSSTCVPTSNPIVLGLEFGFEAPRGSQAN